MKIPAAVGALLFSRLGVVPPLTRGEGISNRFSS
jgi:hypothetical protein